MTACLVPPNATELVVALDDVLGRPIDTLPVDIRKLWRPQECPPEFLAWLAWAVSADVWDRRWPEDQKRRAIARMLPLHRIKGTEAALAGYMEVVGGELVDTLTPSDRLWLLPDRAEEVTAAWKAQLQQLRVYTVEQRRDALPVEHFVDHWFLDYGWLWPDTPETVTGRRSFLFDPKTGEETPLQRFEYNEMRTTVAEDLTEQVMIPRRAGPHTPYLDSFFLDHGWLVDSLEPEILTTTVRNVGETSDIDLIVETLTPSLETTDVWPERLPYQRTTWHLYAFGHVHLDHFFLLDDRPSLAFMDRWYVVSHDTPRINAKPAGMYLDFSCFPPDAYNAIALLKLDGKAKPQRFFLDQGYLDQTYIEDHDPSTVDLAWQAVRASKALRDNVEITLENTTALTLVGPIPLDGSVKFGSRRRRRRI